MLQVSIHFLCLQGVGSRLMAKMGYIVGCGLGKYGEGRLEPVEALVYPPGKSLGKFLLTQYNRKLTMHKQTKA